MIQIISLNVSQYRALFFSEWCEIMDRNKLDKPFLLNVPWIPVQAPIHLSREVSKMYQEYHTC